MLTSGRRNKNKIMSSFGYTYKSPIGPLSIFCNEHSIWHIGISRFTFWNEEEDDDDSEIFTETKCWLDIYFSGKQPDFTPQIDLYGTDFQKKVWNELLSIPFGQTVTYGEIAKLVGCRSAQAVGQVIGQNPILIIVPCHRVVAAQGIGGYSVGVQRKIWLLENENKHSIHC